ncbi:MAG: FeoB-associated Cys-rich membrane protein [Lachnospiraceae bacterium]|nr:FeoB-associated Cys-rich membrane protein [Lachnospiraceae bacterium]
MISWITGNAGTILVTILLLLMVAGIIRTIIRDKKQGRSSCGGNCAHCKMCTARSRVKIPGKG